MKIRGAVLSLCVCVCVSLLALPDKIKVCHPAIGVASTPTNSTVKLALIARKKAYKVCSKHEADIYDSDINSPKSVEILEEAGKFYVNNLEGGETVVYDLRTFRKLKVIKHTFTQAEASLFGKDLPFGYSFRKNRLHPNVFIGKPVEGTFSHKKRYLWITYYRRSYDTNAQEPSAVAIIDTKKDEIVRVMPCGPLPKMIATSHNNKLIAITHWGDNTVSLIDMSSNNVKDWKYLKKIVVGYQMKLNYDNSTQVNRDANCGYCLRGTAFTPDDKYLLIGKMGGGGIAVIDVEKMAYLRTVNGMSSNIRHLIVTNNTLYLSANTWGLVQKTPLKEFLAFLSEDKSGQKEYTNWKTCKVGEGARTISVTGDEKYIFAAVNKSSKVVVVRCADMQKICEIDADSFPVGLSLTANGSLVIVSSQGKDTYKGTGNSVLIYKALYL